MAERTYRNVDVDLDDLADSVVAWFEHDGFDVQDFQEGPSIFIQARKQSLLTKLSFTGQALNVRLTPLSRGFKVEVGAGEWLDKGVGAGVTAIALRFLNPYLAIGTGVATGYGVYQQIKLPEQLLEFVSAYVDQHGVAYAPEHAAETRTPRRGRERDEDVEAELEEMRRDRGARPAPAAGERFCPRCGSGVERDANFCPRCGADMKARPGAPEPPPDEDEGGHG